MKVGPIFKKDDYIINHSSGDMGIIKGITKKGYYQFKAYYDAMLNELKDVKNLSYDLQVNYQKFFELSNDEEKKKLDEIIKEKGGN